MRCEGKEARPRYPAKLWRIRRLDTSDERPLKTLPHTNLRAKGDKNNATPTYSNNLPTTSVLIQEVCAIGWGGGAAANRHGRLRRPLRR